MPRKGLEMPLVLVIAAVVLIVVALIVITMVGGGLTQFGSETTQQQTEAAGATQVAAARSYCELLRSQGRNWDDNPYNGVHCCIVGQYPEGTEYPAGSRIDTCS